MSYARYFAGRGIDIGSGDDPLGRWQSLFPLMTECRAWDLPDGDAQTLPGIGPNEFDFLHSSHCLEHLRDPLTALRRWCEVVKPGGYLVVLVPDEDLYEQGVWPSRWNADHKHTFTLYKLKSWSPVSIDVFDLLADVGDLAIPIRVERLEGTCLPLNGTDHTRNVVTESAIEFVMRRL